MKKPVKSRPLTGPETASDWRCHFPVTDRAIKRNSAFAMRIIIKAKR